MFDTAWIHAPFGWYAAIMLYASAFASGIIPVINIELILIGIGIARGGQDVVALALASSLGQMSAKLLIYFASQKGAEWVSQKQARYNKSLQKWESWARSHAAKQSAFYFFSAFSGFPPFFLVSVLAGTARSSLTIFLSAGFLGRLLRFGLVVLFADKLSPLFGK